MTNGQIAYEAFRVYVAEHKDEMNDPAHPRYAGWLENTPWTALDPVVQAAWEAAAASMA